MTGKVSDKKRKRHMNGGGGAEKQMEERRTDRVPWGEAKDCEARATVDRGGDQGTREKDTNTHFNTWKTETYIFRSYRKNRAAFCEDVLRYRAFRYTFCSCCSKPVWPSFLEGTFLFYTLNVYTVVWVFGVGYVLLFF